MIAVYEHEVGIGWKWIANSSAKAAHVPDLVRHTVTPELAITHKKRRILETVATGPRIDAVKNSIASQCTRDYRSRHTHVRSNLDCNALPSRVTRETFELCLRRAAVRRIEMNCVKNVDQSR